MADLIAWNSPYYQSVYSGSLWDKGLSVAGNTELQARVAVNNVVSAPTRTFNELVGSASSSYGQAQDYLTDFYGDARRAAGSIYSDARQGVNTFYGDVRSAGAVVGNLAESSAQTSQSFANASTLLSVAGILVGAAILYKVVASK